MTSSLIFSKFFFSLVNFGHWSKFHVNIMTGSGFMTISFYKGLTRYLEIRNTSVWVLHNIWRLGRVRSSNLAQKALTKCYWMLRNTRVTAFTGFWVIKGKLTEGIKLPLLFSVVVSLNSWVVIYLPWMNIFLNFYVIVSFWSYILLLETSASTTTLDFFKSTRTETSYLSTLLFSNCFKLFINSCF